METQAVLLNSNGDEENPNTEWIIPPFIGLNPSKKDLTLKKDSPNHLKIAS
jgi:hypothetical protein